MYSLCAHACRKGGVCGGGGSAPREATVGVFGLDGSGKSTLVSGLKNEARPDDVTLPGTCFKPHEFKLKRCTLKAFDIGGHVRPIWKSYYPNVHGVVFVVDGACRERSAEVKATWDEMTAHEYVQGKPILVVANKQDLEGAMTADELCELLGIGGGDGALAIRAVTCCATQDKMLKKTQMGEGMRWLLGSINLDMDELNKRVEKETAAANHVEKERRKKTRKATLLRKEAEKAAADLKAAEAAKASGGASASTVPATEVAAGGKTTAPADAADSAPTPSEAADARTSTAWATPTKDAPAEDKASGPPKERRRKKKGGKRRSNRIRPGSDDDESTQV